MSEESVDIRVSLKQQQKFNSDAKKAAGSIKGLREEVSKSSGVYRDANGRLRDMEGKFVKGAKAADKMGWSWKQANSHIIGGNLALKAVNKTIGMTTRGLKYMTYGALGFAAASLKVGADFESEMSRVEAVTGATGKEMKGLNDLALKMGAETKFSAKESAQGMYELASAGFKANEMATALPGTLAVAAASNLDLADAAEITSNTLRGFRLDSKMSGHVADVMAKAVANSSVEMMDLKDSMKYVAPVAATTGQSLETMTAALEIMGDAGIKGQRGGTTLRSAMLSLINPVGRAADQMKTLHLSTKDFTKPDGTMKQLPDILNLISDRTKHMGKVTRAAALANLFGEEAVSGIAAIMDSTPGKFQKYADGLHKVDGAAADMAKTMQGNTKGALENLKGSIETGMIRAYQWANANDRIRDSLITVTGVVNRAVDGFGQMIGLAKDGMWYAFAYNLDTIAGANGKLYAKLKPMVPVWEDIQKIFKDSIVPAFKQFLKSVKGIPTPFGIFIGLIKWMAKHGTITKNVILGLAYAVLLYNTYMLLSIATMKSFMIITAVTKAVMFAYRAFLLMQAGVKAWTIAQIILNAVLTANPIGAIIVGVMLLVGGFILLYKKVDWFRKGVNAVFNFVKNNWKMLALLMVAPFAPVILMTAKFVKFIASAFKNLKENISKYGVWDGLKHSFKDAINWIINKWNKLSFGIPEVNTHIKGIGKVGGFKLETPDITPLYQGGSVWKPGWSVVGERGPELQYQPAGAQVHPLPMRANVQSRVAAAINPMEAGAFGSDQPIQVHSTIVMPNGRVLAEVVNDEVGRRKARS